jgi:hypothetical protein
MEAAIVGAGIPDGTGGPLLVVVQKSDFAGMIWHG